VRQVGQLPRNTKIRMSRYLETTPGPTQAPIQCVQGDFVLVRASELTASGKIPLASGIYCCPKFFISFARPASLCCEYMCLNTHKVTERLYVNYRCYQVVLRVKHFYTNQEGCEVLTGYLSLWRRYGVDWANT